jgi:hypothetical protein
MWCCVGCNQVYDDHLTRCPTCCHPGRWYEPTAGEIAMACSAIRSRWTEAEEQARTSPAHRRTAVDVRVKVRRDARKGRGSTQNATD